ncbi:MAG: 4Fe-4S binding protein [Nitrospirae bacterium]|nr:4Fe-4S binding protein [Nitrospirota bacterium]MBI3351206.1 4Fe-4S binding protein [Nitrospirota bacterium]
MPVYVNPNICNGCHGATQPPCIRMCPGDLIVKDPLVDKAYLKYPEDCWDCLPCVKSCPVEAIEFYLSYQMGFKNASLKPHIPATRDHIIWESIDSRGKKETFTIRTKVLDIEIDEKVEGSTPVDFSI